MKCAPMEAIIFRREMGTISATADGRGVMGGALMTNQVGKANTMDVARGLSS